MKLRTLLLALTGLCLASPQPASAATILWQVSGTLSGNLLRSDRTLTTVTDAPFVFDLTFDSAAPKQCGAGTSSGVYYANAASLTLLGYRYSLFGAVESNSALGSCNPTGTTNFRLFTTSATPVPTAPNGTPLALLDTVNPLGLGFATIGIPNPAVMGALPTTLPFQPYPVNTLFGLGGVGTQPRVNGSTATVTTVPEPGSLLLGALAVGALALRRRLA